MNVHTRSKPDRRRLWALWAGAGLYFLILLNGARYIGELPTLTVVFGTLLNAAILTTIAVAIRRAYKKEESRAQRGAAEAAPAVISDAHRRKIRVLWLGASLYFVAMVFAIHYAMRLSPRFLAPAAILNMAIVFTFVLKLRKAYLPRNE